MEFQYSTIYQIGELCTYDYRLLKPQISWCSSDWTTINVWLENYEVVKEPEDSPVRLEVRDKHNIRNGGLDILPKSTIEPSLNHRF